MIAITGSSGSLRRGNTREHSATQKRVMKSMIAAILSSAAMLSLPIARAATSPSDGVAPVRIDADDIGGVITSAKGREAGVRVIAETSDFVTRCAKIVVSDEPGRFLIPDLLQADYSVWVRGYGLVDSGKTRTAQGQRAKLTATTAGTAAAAAQIVPAVYWYATMKLPRPPKLRISRAGAASI